MKNHLTEEQARKLLEALPGHPLEAIIMLALVTGLRRDELLRLTWQDLDLEKREMRVRNTKTKSSDRMICLPEGVTEVLKQHRIRQMEAQVEASTAGPHLDLVFPDHTGGVLGPDQLMKGFYEILEQAGLPPLRFHELRLARWRALSSRLRMAKEGLEGAQGGSLDLGNDTYPF
jgi:integrase